MDADQPNSQQLNPAALTAAEAARLLSAAGGRSIPVEAVQGRMRIVSPHELPPGEG